MISAGFWRRFGAWTYDSLVVITILLIAALAAVAANGARAIPPGQIWFEVYLLACVYAYFGLSWHFGGQTLGMRPWRITLVKHDGARPESWRLWLRYLVAWVSFVALGVGYLWALIPPKRATWHDLVSGTRVVAKRPS